MKGDPGSGKSTVSKKMSWDWAMGLFKMFTLVLFESLKLVRPSNAIENIIIQQTPALEGLEITSKQQKRSWKILETDASLFWMVLMNVI